MDVSQFPEKKAGSLELSKRSKGIKRSYANKHLKLFDFQTTVVNKNPARKIDISSLKRHQFKIYLITTRKKILSRFNTKRYFSENYKTKRSYFSFPLNFGAQKLVS